jgi:hypothetical protein
MAKTTPALRHLMRKLAAQANVAQNADGAPQGSAYELMLAQLAAHRRALKDIQSVERKIEAKRGFLPDYDEWVNAAMAADSGAKDQVLTTVLIWSIDAGLYSRGLELATYAVRHGLELPDQYERSLGTALIDEFAQAALSNKLVGDEALQLLPAVRELTDPLDAPDQARAKLYKALGYALIGKVNSNDVDLDKVELANVQQAQPILERALALFDGVGVKKDIERIDRHLKKKAGG